MSEVYKYEPIVPGQPDPYKPILPYDETINIKLNSTPPETTNMVLGSQITSFAKQFALQAAGSYTGFPQVLSINTTQKTGGVYLSNWASLPIDKLSNNKSIGFQYTDFRSKIAYANKLPPRFDGTSAAFRGSWVAGAYAAASASPRNSGTRRGSATARRGCRRVASRVGSTRRRRT